MRLLFGVAMASNYDGHSLLSTSGYSAVAPASPTQAPVAPEHVKRLLGQMSPDGAFFTYEDLVAFVQKHRLPYTEEVLFSMFSEANSTSDGMMDMDQLQKASNFKFQNRRHNHDWVGLFQLAPREPGTRVTARGSTAPPPQNIQGQYFFLKKGVKVFMEFGS